MVTKLRNGNQILKQLQRKQREIAIIHVLTENLVKTREMLTENNRVVRNLKDLYGNNCLFVPRALNDGFSFQIEEQSFDIWIKERVKITDEKLVLKKE